MAVNEEQPANLYTAVAPTCPTHGQMHYAAQPDYWTCAGYDGEGCTYTALPEWQYLGTADNITWKPDD